MSIIRCPNCGKQISSRSERCTFCNTVLKVNSNKNSVLSEMPKMNVKENVIISVLASAMAFIIYCLLSWFSSYMAHFLGLNAVEAIQYVVSEGLGSVLTITIVGMILFPILQILFRNNPDVGHIAGIALPILLCFILYFLQNRVAMQAPREDLISYCIGYSRWNALSLPLLQSVFFLAGYKKEKKKIAISILITAAAYVVMCIAFIVLAVFILRWGIFGITLFQMLFGIVFFAISLIQRLKMIKNM